VKREDVEDFPAGGGKDEVTQDEVQLAIELGLLNDAVS
jgi:hypothetical protein